MDDSDRLSMLRRTQLFRDASDDTLAALAAASEAVHRRAAEVVFEKGSTDDGMYLVAEGELEVYIGDAVLDRIGPGGCFGEMALLTDEPRTAAVRATRDTRLLRLSRAVFRDVLAKHPETALGVFRELASKIRSSIDVRLRQHENLRNVRDAFERSVSRVVMDEILASPDPVALMGGKETRATVVFADIRGFTTIAEGLSPGETIRYLNAYLGALVDLVFAAGGTVDKFIGDAIMAYFGAPLPRGNDAERAVRAAIAMPRALAEVATAQGAAGDRAPRIGVGLATGLVVAGCVGNARRMDYTVMGDTVNLASRIEGLTKAYETRVLFCGETAKAVGAELPVRLVDVVRVKGKSAATELYDVEPSGDARAEYDAAFALYRHGDFAEAGRAFGRLAARRPDDGPARTLARRCAGFDGADAPPSSWDGVFTLTSK